MNIPEYAFSAAHVPAIELAIRNPLISRPTESVASGMARMERSASAECLLIVDTTGRLMGLATRRDLARRMVGLELSPVAISICSVMTSPLFTADSSASVADIAAIMAKKRVRFVPMVTEQQKLLGLVSLRELISFEPQIRSSERRNGLER